MVGVLVVTCVLLMALGTTVTEAAEAGSSRVVPAFTVIVASAPYREGQGSPWFEKHPHRWRNGGDSFASLCLRCARVRGKAVTKKLPNARSQGLP